METFNKTVSNFQTKPYEIMQDNIEFLQNDNNKQETQQQTGSNTSFFDSSEKDANQLNKNIIFKNQANQGYNNQSQHHVVNNQYRKVSKQQNRNHYQKSKQEKTLYIGKINKDVKKQHLIEPFGFNATAQLQENCRVDLPTGENGNNKGFGLAVMPEHVQKELLKIHRITFHGNIITIEEATSTRIKGPDEKSTWAITKYID